MKKYIQPTTQSIALGAERICQGYNASVVDGDPSKALAPERQFQGDSYSSLKYLI